MPILPPLLLWLAKTTLVLAVAGLAALLLRKRSAALRHALWASALVAIVLAPLLQSILPVWRVVPSLTARRPPPRVDVATAKGAQPIPRVARRFELPPDKTVAATAAQGAATPKANTASPATHPAPMPVLLGLWFLGALALLARRIAQQLAAWRFARRAQSLDARQRAALAAPAGQRFAFSEDLSSPAVFGLFRPLIVLPASFFRWPRDERRAVMLHELAHVRRHDTAWQLLADVVAALLFFHPLAWLARREICHLRELAADDIALKGDIDGADYAQILLTQRRRMIAPSATLPAAIVTMARPRNLAQRIAHSLDRRAPRGLQARQVIAVSLATAGLALALGCADHVASPRNSEVARLRLQNDSNAPVDLVWIDFDGRERHYQSIQPGAKALQLTYVGHRWLLRKEGAAAELTRFAAGLGTTHVRVSAHGEVQRKSLREDPAPRGSNDTTRSTDEGTRTEVRFWNLSPRALELTWVDTLGKAHPRGRLAADAGYIVQRSTAGHLFQLRDATTGALRHSERARKTPTLATIARDGTVKVQHDAEPFTARSGVLRSLSGSTPVTLRVANYSGETLRLVWVNYRGGERDYGAVHPHSGFDMASYVTHPWRVYRGEEKIAELVIEEPGEIALRVDATGTARVSKLPARPPRTDEAAPVLYHVGHRAFPAPYGHGLALRFTRPDVSSLTFYEVQFSTDGGHSWHVVTRRRHAWRDWINHHGKARCRVGTRWQKSLMRFEKTKAGFAATQCLAAAQRFSYRVRGLDKDKAPITVWSNVLSAKMPDWRGDKLIDGWQHNGRQALREGAPRSSSEAKVAAELVVENTSTEQAFLFWLDEDGIERFYRRLAPGQTWRQTTRVGHVWRLRGAGKRAIVTRVERALETLRVDRLLQQGLTRRE